MNYEQNPKNYSESKLTFVWFNAFCKRDIIILVFEIDI